MNQHVSEAVVSAPAGGHPARRAPWAWVPTLYFAEGMPYVIVNTVSVIMYKRLGLSNAEIAFFTSWLYLPWGFKGLWSPFIDIYRTKRFWILSMQLMIAVLLLAAAGAVPLSGFFALTMGAFWLIAIASATHDIAADGFYMLALEQHEQAAFVGVRNTFYRVAMLTGTGILVFLAGKLEVGTGGNIPLAWSIMLACTAVLVGLLFLYHRSFLPAPPIDHPTLLKSGNGPLREFVIVLRSFFTRLGWKRTTVTICFLLLYRFPEAQLLKLVSPFLLDARDKGGLGISTSQVGIAYGTVGMIALLLGGILGGILISRHGLKTWLWPMVIVMHFPDLAFVYLSQAQPNNFLLTCSAVGFEQFGYGFGFTAYTMYMILVSDGEHKTAYYAICTGFMAFGMLIPGAFSGALQEYLGYGNFFIWVILCTIPGFIVTALLKIPPDFGRKKVTA